MLTTHTERASLSDALTRFRIRHQRAAVQLTAAVLLGILLASGTLLINRAPPLVILAYYGILLGGILSLLLGDIRRWLLGITIVDASVLLDVNIGFRPETAELGSISGYVLSLTTIVLPVLYGIWAMELLLKKTPSRRPAFRALAPLALYFAGIGLSLTYASNPTLVYYELFMLVQCLLLFIYLAGSLRTRDDILFLLPFIAVALIAQCAVITIQRLGYVNPAIDFFRMNFSARPIGLLGSANVVGAFLGTALIPLLSVLFIGSVRVRWKLLLLPLIAWSALCLVWTQSRGAWIGFVIAFGILILLGWWRRWISSRVFFAILVGGLLILGAGSSVIVERLTTEDGGAAASRGPLNEIALQMFSYRPLTGVGANNFAVEIPNYIPPRLGSEWLYIVHNKYLLVLSETGIIGFLGWMGFLVITVWRGIQVWGMRERTLSLLGLGILAALIGHFSHMLGEIFNMRTMVQLLWTYAAVLYAMLQILRAEPQGASAPPA